MSVDLDELERLEKAAKAAPWWTNAKYSGQELGCSIIAARTDCGPLPGNPTRGQVAFVTAMLNTEARQCEATAAFIAELRNAAPALISLAREALEMRARMDEARKTVEKADIALPFRPHPVYPERVTDSDGWFVADCGGENPDATIAALLLALNLLVEEKTDA